MRTMTHSNLMRQGMVLVFWFLLALPARSNGIMGNLGFDFRVASFVEPTYTPDSRTNSIALLGAWTHTNSTDITRCVFTKSKSEDYVLELTMDGHPLELRGVLFQLGSTRFLDVTAAPESEENPIGFLTRIPGHVVFKLEVEPKMLKLTLMDYDELARLVHDHPDLLR